MIRSATLSAVSGFGIAVSLASAATAQPAADASATPSKTPTARPNGSPPASPQVGSGQTEAANAAEIVVTARKRQERAIEVPIALTVFSGPALERRGVRSVSEVLQEAPGVGVYDNGSGGSKITIRGISTSLGANENGYYLDDLPFTGVTVPIDPDVRAWDLDRIEVLRGPQGTLFGEGSMGGTIRILTRGADLNEWEVKGSGTVSDTSDGGTNWGVRGAANLPIVPGVFAVRVDGTHERFDGWIDDPATSRSNINDQRFDTYRFKARFDPTSRLSITGSYWNYDARFPGGGAVADDAGDASKSVILASKTKYRLFGANARYDFGPAQLFYGYSNNRFRLPQSGQLFGGELLTEIGINVQSHELRLSSTPGRPLQWTVGGYIRNAKRNDTTEFALFGIDNLASTNSRAHALFGEATYSVPGAAVDVTAGLRYYKERLSGFESNAGVISSHPTTDYTSWNPRFSLAWHPRRNATIYASAAKGFRAGQFQPSIASQLAGLFGITLPAALKQDHIWTYELGAKADFLSGLLSAEGSVFYSDWKDVTVRIPIATTGFNGLINSPGTHTKGIELSLVARPTSGLSLAAGGALIDAHYIGAVPGTGIVNGADVEDVAKFTANASADYRWPITTRIKGFARVGWQHASPRNNTSFPIFTKGDSIDRVDARIGADFGRFTLAAFADNLTNDRGATSYRTVQTIAPGVNDVTANRLRPRTIGLELLFGWDRPAR